MIMYLLIYIVLGVLHLAAELGQFTMVSMLTKILLMPTLVMYLWQSCGFKKNVRFLLFGLVFSWFGDILLMFPRDNYIETLRKVLFLSGLIAFLVAHIFYIIAFIKDIHPFPKASVLIEKPYLVLPFLVYLAGLLIFLTPHTGSMTPAIYIYGLTIISMSLAAFNRKNIVTERSFALVFAGAVLFVFSDSIIAVTLFYKHFAFDRVAIMFTYILAQLCITYGFVLNKKDNPVI